MSKLTELAEKETDPENVGGEGEDDNGPAPVSLFRLLPAHCSKEYTLTFNDFIVVQEEESTATFTPVVQLTAVEVKTMEEEEDVLYKQ